MRMKLTARNISALERDRGRVTAWDTEIKGFGLRQTSKGDLVYALKFRFAGAQRWVTIGKHGSPWTPESARKEAKRLLADIANGIDPAEKRAADRKAATVDEIADLYFAEGASHKKRTTLYSDRLRLERHIKPLIGARRVDALTRADVERMLVTVAAGRTVPGSLAKGGAGTAAQCVALVSSVMQFAVDRKLRSDNPCRGIRKPKGRKMTRFLSEAELARLGEAIAAEELESGNPFPAAAIRLLALTGARKSEILHLRWSEVDLKTGCSRSRT